MPSTLPQALAVARDNPGLWAEFGVASGKSTAYIAQVMDKTFGGSKTLHGFDSFVGIPEAWNSLQQGTFTMEGVVPEVVLAQKNVEVHKGKSFPEVVLAQKNVEVHKGKSFSERVFCSKKT